MRALMFAAWLALSGLALAGSDLAPIHVIVHAPGTGELSTAQLRNLFVLRVDKWPDGNPVTVFTLPSGHPVHERFAKTLLQTFPNQLERLWNRMVYAGMSQGPHWVDSEAEMLAAVRATPGAIGYVSTVPDGSVQTVEITP